jgi:hypothetical protein
MAGTFTKLAVSDVATLMSRAVLPLEAQASVAEAAETSAHALDRLEAAGFASEAVRILAHALLKPEGVWWACMCASSTAPRDLSNSDRSGARDRRALGAAAERRAGLCEAMVLWQSRWLHDTRRPGPASQPSGVVRTIAPPGPARPCHPCPTRPTHAVAAAVTLASVRGDGKPATRRACRRFLHSGREIARGRRRQDPAGGWRLNGAPTRWRRAYGCRPRPAPDRSTGTRRSASATRILRPTAHTPRRCLPA